MDRIDDIACPLDCACGYCGKIIMLGELAAQWASDDGETTMAYWHAECADKQEALEAEVAKLDAEDPLDSRELVHDPEADAHVDLMFRRLRHNEN